jgi:hypothetical protein
VDRAALTKAAPARQARSVPAEELQRGKNAFDRGEYKRAIEILSPLLYPDIRLESDGQIVQAHRMLGVAQLFEGAEANAAQEFRKLLQLRPDYRFDPLLDPPQVVDVFNSVLREQEAEVARLEAKRRDAEQARERDRVECEKVRGGPAVIERKVGRNSFAVNFIPFGAGQFQNGHRRKGWAFLIGESALAAVSVGAFATNLALYGLRPKLGCKYDTGGLPCPRDDWDHTDEDRSRLLLRTQVVSGALFFATAAWGILDAIYFYKPESHLGDTPVPQPSHALRLTPIVLPHTLGTGLSFRF